MRAIDLYSGVGGWSCGFSLSGIDVVRSYEIDPNAIATNRINTGHECVQCDILNLDYSELPANIDVVVGSPPCTQFSYSNRGGQGNIETGLAHIRKFLEVVDYLKPSWWVMENVPRTLAIVGQCFKPGGEFEDLAHLEPNYFRAEAERYGTPQRRRRALIGNVDFSLLERQESEKFVTLEDVLLSLSSNEKMLADPVYGVLHNRTNVSDLALEEPLDDEEMRINRNLKASHHIYNKMSFPDDELRSSRTLTATCTRVSRESIIIRDRRAQCKADHFRRLSIRERASLQGFPLNYVFSAKSYAGKIKQIGNAIPPTLSFAVGCTILGKDRKSALKALTKADELFAPCSQRPKEFLFERKRLYQGNRSYRFALNGLNFGSGVRFELANNAKIKKNPDWQCSFWYGTSKKMLTLPLENKLLKFLETAVDLGGQPKQAHVISEFIDRIRLLDGRSLQRVWSHKGPGLMHPFQLADQISDAAEKLDVPLLMCGDMSKKLLDEVFASYSPESNEVLPKNSKLRRYASKVLSGLYVCSVFNCVFDSNSALEQKTVQKIANIEDRFDVLDSVVV